MFKPPYLLDFSHGNLSRQVHNVDADVSYINCEMYILFTSAEKSLPLFIRKDIFKKNHEPTAVIPPWHHLLERMLLAKQKWVLSRSGSFDLVTGCYSFFFFWLLFLRTGSRLLTGIFMLTRGRIITQTLLFASALLVMQCPELSLTQRRHPASPAPGLALSQCLRWGLF